MKRMGLMVLVGLCAVMAVSSQAEAKKAPKHKVVISFTEADIRNAHRMPASVDDKDEVDATARMEARAKMMAQQDIPGVE